MMFLLFPLHLLPVLFRTQTKLVLKCFGKCERILIANLLRHCLHRKPCRPKKPVRLLHTVIEKKFLRGNVQFLLENVRQIIPGNADIRRDLADFRVRIMFPDILNRRIHIHIRRIIINFLFSLFTLLLIL